MASDSIIGYALIQGDGPPDLATVAGTERAATVNALVARYGHMVYASDSDESIRQAFARLRGPEDKVALVRVTPILRKICGPNE